MPEGTNLNDMPEWMEQQISQELDEEATQQQLDDIASKIKEAESQMDEPMSEEEKQKAVGRLVKSYKVAKARDRNATNDGQPSKEDLDKITDIARENAYSLFVVHEDSGKVEILENVQPGVVSYAFDPMRVTPRDIRYMLEAVFDAAGISGPDDVKFLLLPLEGFKQAIVVLDIKNRSNIEIGTMELWRYSR